MLQINKINNLNMIYNNIKHFLNNQMIIQIYKTHKIF